MLCPRWAGVNGGVTGVSGWGDERVLGPRRAGVSGGVTVGCVPWESGVEWWG